MKELDVLKGDASYCFSDRQLRKKSCRSAKSQLTLIGQIGLAWMENELLKRYKIIKEYSKTINVFLEISRTH
jgi:hypothetical protein